MEDNPNVDIIKIIMFNTTLGTFINEVCSCLNCKNVLTKSLFSLTINEEC